ncbi:MAG: TetR/AcrR family transcriptional regulator [Clostridium sp.]|uniref:TetR/AcrR family transcriptional regulator n=1 Tax=Clostridium sp. TaxID=1506 RepID=UPI002FCB1B48
MRDKSIIEVAMGLFNSKGISETSIDEIVKSCKISKATFYKLFKSKEELVGAMAINLKEEFVESIVQIEEDKQKDSREVLASIIVKTIEFVNSSMPFYTQVVEGYSAINGESTKKVRRYIREFIINEYYKSVVKAYGASSNTWDIVFAVDSLVHQFNYIYKINGTNISLKEHGGYIISVLDLVSRGINGQDFKVTRDTLLASNSINPINDNREELLVEVTDLKVLSTDMSENIIEAINIIEEEIISEKYKSVILEGMLMFIEVESLLQNSVSKIRRIIKRM